MDVIMDGLLLAATCFAALYCWVLSRRVRALQSLDAGLGGAIVTLTRQIELARATLEEAKSGARETRADLSELTARADGSAAQLRLLLAALERTPAPALSAAAARSATSAEPLVARRPEPVAAGGPRAVLAEAESGGESGADSPASGPQEEPATVPKPRQMLDGWMRRRSPAAAPDPGETDVVAALTALAGGGDR